MPEIKEGAIFEIQYSVESPFTWNLYDWEFQQSIPTKYSEYYVSYPDWFDYKVSFKGYDYQYLTINDSGTSMDKITYSYFKSRIGEHGIRDSDRRTENIDFIKKQLHYVAENMPAFIPESYSSATTNYLTALEFELAAVSFPNSPYKNFAKTWDNINDQLSKNEKLGGQIGNLKVNSFKDEVNVVTSGKEDAASQIEAIYYHIKEKIVWNKQSRVFASVDIKKTYKEGKGNSADINLLLVAMLKAGGFDARPMVLSTRSHGYLNELFPARSQFNYLICAVKNEDDTYQLIDATDRSLPMNILPPRCINGKGMIITKEGHTWLDLTPNTKYRHVRQVKATLTDDLTWTGTMDVKCKDYAARQMRQNYLTEGNEKSYVQMIQNQNTGLNLTNPTLEMETMAKATNASYDMTLKDNVMDGGEMLYFNPMLTFAVEENPFKLKERKYPVDYNYPYEYIYSASFEIPENYAIEELPENLSLALPEKGGRFSYTMSANGNTINLTSQLKISKYLFLPEEYAGLKEFYNLLIDKMAAQVVLKKK
jgi:transglutaminase-like putative cysteine protease